MWRAGALKVLTQELPEGAMRVLGIGQYGVRAMALESTQ